MFVDPSGYASISAYYWWGYRITMTNADVQRALALRAAGMTIGGVALAIAGPHQPIAIGITALLGLSVAHLMWLNAEGKGIYIYRTYLQLPWGFFGYRGTTIWYQGIR
jgi:uncharacterized membrane protein